MIAMEAIRILVTLDQNYLPQLRVLLTSMRVNNPGEAVELYLMHSALSDAAIESIRREYATGGWRLFPVRVDGDLFRSAPVTTVYPREMYYRLLAPLCLPEDVARVLYLDPDILVINPIRPLWETDMRGCLFAAAAHTGKTELANNLNRARLGTRHKYYNSGVLLIDLAAGRREIVPEAIFKFAAENAKSLVLPDQDILNAMYGSRVLPLDDYIWNYDARNYSSYLMRSSGRSDMDWVMAHTAILHFCGRAKPWNPGYAHRFGVLYKHYMQMSLRGGAV